MPLATLNDYKEDKETHESEEREGGQGRSAAYQKRGERLAWAM